MPIVSSSTGPARPNSFNQLKARVARVVGGDTEPTMLAAAGELLNEAITEFNTRLYEFNKIGPTSITCDATGLGTLPSAFYKEIECTLVDSSGNRTHQLNYIDWAEYQHTWSADQQLWLYTSTTNSYTLFNTYRAGQIQLLPITASTSTAQTVKISYYQRIPELARDDEIMDAPREIQRALILWAQADILRIYRNADPAVWTGTKAVAEQAWDRFRVIDAKHPDMKPRFRLPPIANQWYWGWP